jgi:hypothetical protein
MHKLWQLNMTNRMRSIVNYFKKPLSKMIGIILLCIVFSSHTFAQKENAHLDITVNAKLDTSAIQIGQQTKLTLSIQYKVNTEDRVRIQWPDTHDSLRKEIEIVEQTKIDTLIPNKEDPFTFVQTKTLYITSFDSGYWAIPPFKFIVNGDTAGIYSDALLLSVSTISIDTTQAIKDIKQPYSISYSWIDWIKDHKLLVSGIVIGLIALCILIFFVLKSLKNKPPPVVEEVIKIPAHIIALEKLEKLKEEKRWQEGKLKSYYSSLTDIIREYIEHRFKIQAMEQTTDEILTSFRNVAIDKESQEKLRQLLLLGDLVKFAKEHPLPTENEMSMDNAFAFVNGTKREEDIVPPANPTQQINDF